MLVNPKTVGIIIYIRVFLMHLIWLYPFKKVSESEHTKCYICGKSLKERRFELSIDRPELDYESEFDKFLCRKHAIQTLLRYKGE